MARKTIIPAPNNRKSWLLAMIVIIILILIMIFSAIKVYGQAPERPAISKGYNNSGENYTLNRQRSTMGKIATNQLPFLIKK